MNNMTMGQRIADQRKKLGLSQEALGEKVGVSRQAISKWESDGAVPEIDKLISLSRLFSVSVGWLLGVEENTPAQPDELTETQLKMVEEIVKRYQPRPEKKKFPWGAVIAIAAAVLAVIAIVRNPSAPDYSNQIGNLQGNYQSIQSQLQSLTGRVEDIASAAEEADKVLQSHEFKLVRLNSENNTAVLTFAAHPKEWSDNATGLLSVSREGEQVFYDVCQWNGASCTIPVELPIADGYEYCFVMEHGDGTQQIQMLEEYDYCDLAYGTSLQCTVESYGFSYDPRLWTFEIDHCSIWAEKPTLGNYVEASWTEAGMILYLNGTEVDRNMILVESDQRYSDSDKLYREYYDLYFLQLKLEEGDEVELTFYAALEGGMDMESPIGRWTFTDGKLTTIAEE